MTAQAKPVDTADRPAWAGWTLAAILLAAFVLRLWGVDYGLPSPLVSDEEVMIGGALRMLELRTVIPALHAEEMAVLYYPVVLPYLYMAVITPFLGGLYLAGGMPPLNEFALQVFDNMGTVFLLARLTSVVLATLSVYVIYRIGLLLFRRHGMALAAAALLATDFLHAFLGHFARHWSATVLLVWLTVWLACLIYRRQERRHYVLAGVTAAIGFGVSYIGCLGIVAAGIAHLARGGLRHMFSASAWWMAGVFFTLSALSVALYPQPAIRLLNPQGVLPLDDPKTLTGLIDAAGFYGRTLFFANPVLSLGCLAGLVAAVIDKQRWLAGAFFAATAAGVAFLYLFMPLEDRYIMPLVPLMALTAAYGAGRFTDYASRAVPRRIVVVGLSAFLVFPAAVSGQAAHLLAQDDTRQQAKSWAEATLASGSRVAVAQNSVKLATTRAALTEQRTLDPGSLKAADRARLAAPADTGTGGEALHALHLNQMSRIGRTDARSAGTLAELRRLGYTHLIADYNGVSAMTGLHKAARQQGEPIARFLPGPGEVLPPFLRTTLLVQWPMHRLFRFDRFGPAVEIFRLTQGAQDGATQ